MSAQARGPTSTPRGHFSAVDVGHGRSLSASQQRKASSSSEASTSSQVTAVSSSRATPHPGQNPGATASTSSLASSSAGAGRANGDLPLRQTTPSGQPTPSSRLRQHSQGFFEPSLPHHGNLTASAIAAQAAMHGQAPAHTRRRSQNVPEPLVLNRPPLPRKSSQPTPMQTVPPTSGHSSSSQSRNNSMVDTRGAAAFAANAAFPRSPSHPVTSQIGRVESPLTLPEKETKPHKKESRMKLFSKPRHAHMSRDKESDKKGLPSPKSIYSSVSSKVNQSSTSLVEPAMSGASSLYSSTNASTSTLTPSDRTLPGDKEKHRHRQFLSRSKHKLRDGTDHHHLPLSSASSNSRPVDPAAPQPLYSFAPSSPGPGSKSVTGLDLRHGGRAIREKRKEEKAAASGFVPPVLSATSTFDAAFRTRQESYADTPDPITTPSTVFGPSSTSTFTSQVSAELGLPAPSLASYGLQGMGADDAWPLLKARLLNIFEGEDLRTPIEDFNRLLSIHLQACIKRRAPSVIVEDLRDLLHTGFASLDQTLRGVPDERLVSHLVEMWTFVFGTILPFIQAVFLPLDQEFKGRGPIMSSREAADFWGALPQASHRPSIATITPENSSSFGTKPLVLDVRTMVFQGFRDIIIIPRHDVLLAIFSRLSLESINAAATAQPDSHAFADRPGTASSGSGGFSSSTPGSFDPSSFNSQGSTYLDSSGAGSLGARSRATSNTSAGSFYSIGSTRPGAQRANRSVLQAAGAGTLTSPRAVGSSGAAPLTHDSAKVTNTAAKMLQCFSVLAGPNASPAGVGAAAGGDDEGEAGARKKMERLAGELKLNWLGRGRTGRNRRGLVGTRPVRVGDAVGVAA